MHVAPALLSCATGNQSIKIYNVSTTQGLSPIQYHTGFMGQKIGQTKCLAFHPHRVSSCSPFRAVCTVCADKDSNEHTHKHDTNTVALCVCERTCMCACGIVYVHSCARMFVCVCVCILVCVSVCVCVCVYLYVCVCMVWLLGWVGVTTLVQAVD